jgi:hypothetical protein
MHTPSLLSLFGALIETDLKMGDTAKRIFFWMKWQNVAPQRKNHW